MEASELLTQIYYAYRGKGASKVPAWGSEKANTALAIANRKVKEWARDPKAKWNSLFEVRTVGTIDFEDFSYDLPTDLLFNSDFAQITKTDSSIAKYPIVTPGRRELLNQAFYISGRNPKTINWGGTEMDEGLDGGTLKIAGYFVPDDLALETDVVPVDDPNWLIYATAAELARNDAAKDDQFANLTGMANDLYQKMLHANVMPGFMQPNGIPNLMPTIGSSTGDDWAGSDE